MGFFLYDLRRWIARNGHVLALTAASVAVAVVFRRYFSGQPLFSDDLHSHVALIERLARELAEGRIRFYDTAWFGGWPAFEFYPFLPHLLAAVMASLFPWSVDPFQFAANVLLIAGFMALPWTLFYCALPVCRDVGGRGLPRRRLMWAGSLGAVAGSFWFLFSDAQVLGIGAKYVLEAGVLAQPLALNLLLLLAGAWLRQVAGGADVSLRVLAIVCLTLLFLTHLLTAVFALLLAAALFVWSSRCRWRLFADTGISMLAAAFFLAPLAFHLPAFGAADPRAAGQDVSGMLFQYAPGILPKLPTLDLRQIDLLTLGAWLALALLLFHPAARHARLLRGLGATVLVLALLISGDYWVGVIPAGIHYQRLLAPLFLIIAVGLCSAPCVLAAGRRGASAAGAVVGIVLVVLALSALWRADPQLQRAHLLAGNGFSDEQMMLGLVGGESEVGRIVLERFTDPDVFDIAPGKYLEARLSRAGYETLNGLMVQSSRAFVFDAAALLNLQARVFGVPSALARVWRDSPRPALEHLRRRGATHVIAASTAFARQLETLGAELRGTAGPYRLYRLGAPVSRVVPVTRPAVGFLDMGGDLEYRWLQYYFHEKDLARSIALLQLQDPDPFPGLRQILASDGDSGLEPGQGALLPVTSDGSMFRLGFRAPEAARRYPWRGVLPSDPDAGYAGARAFLDQAGLPRVLPAPPVRETAAPPVPRTLWTPDGRGFRVSGLHPGTLYHVGYSYFPYWRADSGRLFQDGHGEMLYLAAAEGAVFEYRRRSSRAVWLGWALSLVGLLLAARIWRDRH